MLLIVMVTPAAKMTPPVEPAFNVRLFALLQLRLLAIVILDIFLKVVAVEVAWIKILTLLENPKRAGV